MVVLLAIDGTDTSELLDADVSPAERAASDRAQFDSQVGDSSYNRFVKKQKKQKTSVKWYMV